MIGTAKRIVQARSDTHFVFKIEHKELDLLINFKVGERVLLRSLGAGSTSAGYQICEREIEIDSAITHVTDLLGF
jgi:hypothetical protein